EPYSAAAPLAERMSIKRRHSARPKRSKCVLRRRGSSSTSACEARSRRLLVGGRPSKRSSRCHRMRF
ncbi:unnamed protein product, partial [Symbiodinium microadriaticum]